MTVSWLLAAGVRPAHSEPEKTISFGATPAPPQALKAVERGLAFLVEDAARWREEHRCATRHHGNMTVWALSEAKDQGYEIAAETLALQSAPAWSLPGRDRSRYLATAF